MKKLLLPLCLSTAALALTGCGGDRDAPADTPTTAPDVAPAADPQPPAIVKVSVGDVLGQFDGTVPSLAVWQHPTRAFESAVVAANGEAGLYVLPIDGGAPSLVQGVFSGGVDVTYAGGAAMIAAYEGTLGAIQLFTIDPADLTLGLVTDVAVLNGAKALCFLDQQLFRVDEDGGLFRHDLSVNDTGAITADETALPGVGTVQDCAGGREELHLLTTDGRVQRLEAGRLSPKRVGAAPEGATAILAVHLEAETLPLLISPTGAMLGEQLIEIEGFGQSGAAIAPTLAAMGNGNFGGVYRAGMIALLDGTNELSLLPWIAIDNALGEDGPGPTTSAQGATAGVGPGLLDERVVPDTELSTEPPQLQMPDLDLNPPSDER